MIERKACCIYTRFGKTDGVSLQSVNFRHALEKRGFTIYTLAGEAPPDLPRTKIAPLMHFSHPEIQKISKRAFSGGGRMVDLRMTHEIEKISQKLEKETCDYLYRHQFDLLVIFNALTIPMNLPLGLALGRVLEILPTPRILRHYDFYWERERFRNNTKTAQILDLVFPPKNISLTAAHLVLNSVQQKFLVENFGIKSRVLPDTFDYQSGLNKRDKFNAAFRRDFKIEPGEIIFLQPSRIIPRKRIERTIELLRRLSLPNTTLLLTGYAGDEGYEYLSYLKREVRKAGIRAVWAGDQVGFERKEANGRKIYALWDAYVNSDFVCLPSDVEGFGNHVVEALYFKKPLFVNNYPVFESDIAPAGVKAVVIEDKVTDKKVSEVRRILKDPELYQRIVEENFKVGQKCFSEKRLAGVLDQALASLGLD